MLYQFFACRLTIVCVESSMKSNAVVNITTKGSPLDLLPNGLLSLILHFASTHHMGRIVPEIPHLQYSDFRTVLLLVCRRWNQVATSCPPIWANLQCRYPLSLDTACDKLGEVWKTHLKRAGPSIPLGINLAFSQGDPIDQLLQPMIALADQSSRLKFLHYTTTTQFDDDL